MSYYSLRLRADGKLKSTIDWLLENDQPSIRYLALRELIGKPESDADVRSTRKVLAERGWVADILAKQNRLGWWVSDESMHQPKYLSTNWMLLILSDLGITREDPRIRKACELWIQRGARPDGGFGKDYGAQRSASHLCIVGNTVRALIKFGYVDHPQVRSGLEWLVRGRAEEGGWNCFGRGRNLDSWEGMSAFAVYPRQRWTRGMKLAVEKGAEFYLERRLHRQGRRYPPWYRFHYPVHHYYDLLVGLEFMTALGYGDDRRLNYAINLLKEKRRPNGRWNLDANHPDVAGWDADFLKKNPKYCTPFALEKPGVSSKMITLKAMTVLNRLNG